MNPLLVGEANPYSKDPRHALLPWPERAAGDRLRAILGLTEREYLRSFDRCNLVVGRRWNLPDARRAASALVGRPTPLILLGRKVASAFCVDGPPFSRAPPCFYLLPHPSGLCRAWNEPGAEERARALLAEFLLRERM